MECSRSEKRWKSLRTTTMISNTVEIGAIDDDDWFHGGDRVSDGDRESDISICNSVVICVSENFFFTKRIFDKKLFKHKK